jgi:hypothetical protein
VVSAGKDVRRAEMETKAGRVNRHVNTLIRQVRRGVICLRHACFTRGMARRQENPCLFRIAAAHFSSTRSRTARQPPPGPHNPTPPSARIAPPTDRNHGDRIDRAERARLPEATPHLPQLQGPERQVEEEGQGRPEMVQGRRPGLQDPQDRH